MAKFKIILISILLFTTMFSLKSCKKKTVRGCTDSKASNYNSNATEDDGSCTYAPKVVGEAYQGGLIFYVDASGQHGLIAALTNQSSSLGWHNGTVLLIGTTGTARGTGASNTLAITAALGAGTYAASVCNDLVSGGYSDWFLPSKDELNLMYLNLFKKSLGGFSFARYWSSSEADTNNAFCQDFSDGSFSQTDKIGTISVRAARAF